MTARNAQKLYVLGHPVAHSKSPVMYNAVYRRLGLPWEYALMDCATEAEAEAFLAARDFLAINITTPYKPHAFAAATNRAASAKLAHGANVLAKKGEALIAYNTDGQGCVANLERTGFSFAGKKAVVCGTGPTALSIAHAVAVAGVAELALLSRAKEKAHETLSRYVEELHTMATATMVLPAAEKHHRSLMETYRDTKFKFGAYETSSQTIAAADVIIDATPLGMKEGDPAPFNTELLHEGKVVFDVVYGHGETALIRAARAAGCAAHDGAGMLVGQAVASVRIVCDLAEMDVPLSNDELFSIMANAASFHLG